MTDQKATFEGWAIVELLGHRKLAGYVREAQIAGHGMLRIDVPRAGVRPSDQFTEDDGTSGVVATQFYPPTALYCLTPCTEDLARRVAASAQPAPVTRWELPPAAREEQGSAGDGVDDGQDEDQPKF